MVLATGVLGAKISTLYSQRPWDTLDRPIASVALCPTGWFQAVRTAYRDFEDHHRQALWKSTHVLPIIVGSSRAQDPGLSVYYYEGRRRRSRSISWWKAVLRIVLQGLVEGRCDLYILLDPFFLHFSGRLKKWRWHPGFGF